MLEPKFFIETLRSHGINFFAGVPDSLLKQVCGYITDHIDPEHHVIAANEGAAVALGAGHYLATRRIPLIYMQNSGEGNIINPLLSLTDKEVYNIPELLLIGWRGKPGVHDEPQHIKQGKVTADILDAVGIKWLVLSKDGTEMQSQVASAVDYMKATGECYALIVEKDTFGDYTRVSREEDSVLSLLREQAVDKVAEHVLEKDVIVSTTGMISRELFEYRVHKKQGHERDFLTVGSMGHACQIALGIALNKKDRRVWCFDGDGAAIMHMGSMAVIGSIKPDNFIHVVFNNGAHDSVGGQPTAGMKIDLPDIAKGCGYGEVLSVKTESGLAEVLSKLDKKEYTAPVFVEIQVKKGNRKDLGRPTTTPVENKEAFMRFLQL